MSRHGYANILVCHRGVREYVTFNVPAHLTLCVTCAKVVAEAEAEAVSEEKLATHLKR